MDGNLKYFKSFDIWQPPLGLCDAIQQKDSAELDQLNEDKDDAEDHPDVETGDIGNAGHGTSAQHCRYRPQIGRPADLSLANIDVRVRRMVIAMASRSAMEEDGRKRASQEIVRKTVDTM